MRDYPDIWLHVDAAWLGAVFSCPELRERCRVPAINKHADSIGVNFHKVHITCFSFASAVAEGFVQWGLVSLDCSSFWVRNRRDLTEALDTTPPALRSPEEDGSQTFFPSGSEMNNENILGTVIGYRNWSPGMGRRFRSSKLWFGVEGYQVHIRRVILHSHIRLAFVSHGSAVVHKLGQNICRKCS